MARCRTVGPQTGRDEPTGSVWRDLKAMLGFFLSFEINKGNDPPACDLSGLTLGAELATPLKARVIVGSSMAYP